MNGVLTSHPRELGNWPVSVDLGSPLAKGMRFFIVASGGIAVDVFNNVIATNNGTITSRATATPWRAGELDSTDFWSFADDDRYDIIGDITLLWRGTVDTGSAFRHFCGKHSGGGGASNPYDFRTDNAATPNLNLVRAGALAFTNWTSTITVTLGSPETYSVRCGPNLNSTARFGRGRTFQNDGDTTSGTPAGNAETLRIGRRADGAVQMDGAMEWLIGYDRQLSDAEVSLYADGLPDILLRQRGFQQHFIPTSAAAPGGFNAGFAAGSNVVLQPGMVM